MELQPYFSEFDSFSQPKIGFPNVAWTQTGGGVAGRTRGRGDCQIRRLGKPSGVLEGS